MIGTPMRRLGSLAQILVKEPRRSNQVRIIPGDPSPKRRGSGLTVLGNVIIVVAQFAHVPARLKPEATSPVHERVSHSDPLDPLVEKSGTQQARRPAHSEPRGPSLPDNAPAHTARAELNAGFACSSQCRHTRL